MSYEQAQVKSRLSILETAGNVLLKKLYYRSRLYDLSTMMNDRVTNNHILTQSHPSFLDELDTNWTEAANQFSDFAYRTLRLHPFRILSFQSLDDQNDMIQDIIIHFIQDKGRVLRMYRDTGRPFSTWFYAVASKKAIDIVRKGSKYKQTDPISDMHPNPYSGPEDITRRREIINIVMKCISSMRKKCQILLKAKAEEYTYPEMALMLGLSSDQNKKVSDDLRACRNQLKNLLKNQGINGSDWSTSK